MTTHPARLTEIITGMVPAFAGVPRSREQQIAEAVELVIATNPTMEELADARQAVLDRHQDLGELVPDRSREINHSDLQDRAKKAEALAIAERRLFGDRN